MRINIKQFSLPLLMLSLVTIAFLFGNYIPLVVKTLFYTASITLKEILNFALPFIVFSLIFSSLVKLRSTALSLLALILPLICMSNFVVTWYAYLVGSFAVDIGNFTTYSIASGTQQLIPWFSFKLPVFISTQLAMVIAIVCSLVTIKFPHRLALTSANKMLDACMFFLQKLFIPTLPIMIFGFVLEIQHEGLLQGIIIEYSLLLLTIIIAQILYLSVYYLLASMFDVSKVKLYLSNVLPAAFTGFTTMSSAAALPLSLKAATTNTGDNEIANFVIPATVNFHLIGDCIAIPVLAVVIMQTFGLGAPSVSEYFMFSIFFVIAKFGVAAVPGGGILVMWPILASQLGFNAPMLTLIQTIYVLFDPIITAVNITGNGAFAVIFNRVVRRSNSSRLSLVNG